MNVTLMAPNMKEDLEVFVSDMPRRHVFGACTYMIKPIITLFWENLHGNTGSTAL